MGNVREQPGGYEVWACPGTPVTIGWYVSSDVKEVSINQGIGAVKIPFGTITVPAPNVDTDYVVSAKGGDCNPDSTVRIKVIKDGTTGQINLPYYPRGYWESELKKDFYDEKIQITSISIDNDKLTTGQGWELNKIDTNGNRGLFPGIVSTLTTPLNFPIQLAGTHHVTLRGQTPYLDTSTAPQMLGEKVTMACKLQP
jgi:hypothetical protein